MNEVKLHYSIEPACKTIIQIEAEIKNQFKTDDRKLFKATAMVVSELIENAIKYRKSQDSAESIDFTFAATDNIITIIVTNPVKDDIHINEFKEHIKRIQNSNNPEELYTNRLRELIEKRDEKKAQLGLYRIAYEGKYNLSYKYDNQILTVTAVRNL